MCFISSCLMILAVSASNNNSLRKWWKQVRNMFSRHWGIEQQHIFNTSHGAVLKFHNSECLCFNI